MIEAYQRNTFCLLQALHVSKPGESHATSADAYREVLRQQLFLLNGNLNNAILRTRDECVQVWTLQLVGVQPGKLYSLQDLQASYKAAAKVMHTSS